MFNPDEWRIAPQIWADLLWRRYSESANRTGSWYTQREITLCIDSMELQMMGIKPC